MVYLAHLFPSHMGHGYEYPLTLYAHLMFAFCGVVFNDILLFPSGHSQRNFIHLSITFFFYLYTRLSDKKGVRLRRDIVAYRGFRLGDNVQLHLQICYRS